MYRLNPIVVAVVLVGMMSWPMVALAGSGCGYGQSTAHGEKSEHKKDIVATAASAGSFNTLLAAAKAAGLVEALQADGPLTVFAPTDEAFAKLPEGTVEALLKPENRDQLRAILLYHVVPGKVKAEQVTQISEAKTAFGQKIAVKTTDSGVMVDQSRVIKTDIMTSNGVIHVIDRVLLPKNIVEVAQASGQFNTLLAAAKAAGLADTLASGQLTVFAPTDEAFSKLPAGTVETLLMPENLELLQSILKYHVSPMELSASDVAKMRSIPTANGQALNVKIVEEEQADGTSQHIVMINDARVVVTDIPALNGVIHVIDAVVLPAERTASSQAHGSSG